MWQFSVAIGRVDNYRNDRRVSQMVDNLGDELEFGFGVEEVVPSVAKSMEGAACRPISVALKDCYSNHVSIGCCWKWQD